MEGARREGFRAVSLLGVREPALLAQARSWADAAEAQVAAAPRFAAAFAEGRLKVATRIFGLDAVLGPLEPNTTVTGHEAGVLVDVVADTEELAKEAAYYAFIRLFIGPYPGRKTTAGNAAAPIMPVVVPVSEVFTFSIYHLLPAGRPAGAVRPVRRDVPAARRRPGGAGRCACMTPPRSSAARTPDPSRSRSTCSSPTRTATAWPARRRC